MKRLWLLVLLVPAALLLYGMVMSGRSQPPSEPLEPPPLALAIDGVEQRGALGSHCWSSSVRLFCGTAAGPVTAGEPLVATSPFTATVRLPSNEPDALSLRVIPAARATEMEATATGQRIWRHTREDIQHRYDLSGQSVPTLELDLEPGLYILGASARWAEGSAAIGWLVESQ